MLVFFFYAIEDFKETYMDALKPFKSKSLDIPNKINVKHHCAPRRCETIY